MENRTFNIKKWIIPFCIIILLIASIILVVLNQNEIAKKNKDLGKEEVLITYNGKEVMRFDLDIVKSLPKTITDEGLNTSHGREEVTFGGVLLKDVFNEIGFDLTNYKNISFKAKDGYTSPSSVDEVLDTDKVFLVYERNGEQTKPKEDGGTGPMEIIIAGEQFSLRNCKFLMEIILE